MPEPAHVENGRLADGDDVLVVGGGLTGLAAALALQARGRRVRVIERGTSEHRSGTAVSVDRELLQLASVHNTGDLPVIRGGSYDIAAWDQLFEWLSAHVESAGIPRERGQLVTSVIPGNSSSHAGSTLVLGDGTTRTASIVIGADGIHSTMRRHVIRERPFAEPTGYLAWRGIINETDLPRGTPRPRARESFAVHFTSEFALGAYVAPGSDRSVAPGHRRLAFAWIDPRHHGSPENEREAGEGRFAPIASGRFEPAVIDDLIDTSRRSWPAPWDVAIAETLSTGTAFATPVGQYCPERLVNGLVALIGDAAHAVTPITGAGLHNGLLDVVALAEAVNRRGPTAQALAEYETERLRSAQLLVAQGTKMGEPWARSPSPR